MRQFIIGFTIIATLGFVCVLALALFMALAAFGAAVLVPLGVFLGLCMVAREAFQKATKRVKGWLTK